MKASLFFNEYITELKGGFQLYLRFDDPAVVWVTSHTTLIKLQISDMTEAPEKFMVEESQSHLNRVKWLQ